MDQISGGGPEEFGLARSFIGDLLKKVPSIKRTFVVPGNHDNDWSSIDRKEDQDIREKLNGQELVQKFYLDKGWKAARERVFLRQKNYFDFLKKLKIGIKPSEVNNRGFYSTNFTHEQTGRTIGVSGLNSAWFSTAKDHGDEGDHDDDKGNLILGDYQMIEAFDALDSADIKIAIMHHPPCSGEWFKAFDKSTQERHLTKYNFVLRGHEHSQNAQLNKLLGSEQETLNIAAGSLHGPREDKRTSNSFNVVKLNFAENLGFIFLWSFYDEDFVWDIFHGRNHRSGYMDFSLSPIFGSNS